MKRLKEWLYDMNDEDLTGFHQVCREFIKWFIGWICGLATAIGMWLWVN